MDSLISQQTTVVYMQAHHMQVKIRKKYDSVLPVFSTRMDCKR